MDKITSKEKQEINNENVSYFLNTKKRNRKDCVERHFCDEMPICRKIYTTIYIKQT